MVPKRLLMRGEPEHADFSEVWAWLRHHVELVNNTAECIDGIVYFQSRPGLLSQREVEGAYRRHPFARQLLVAGSWAEGETRSGWPLAGVERCYAYEAIARITAWGDSPPLPRTTNAVEYSEAGLQSLERTPLAEMSAKKTVVIAAKNIGLGNSLLAAAAVLGFTAQPFGTDPSLLPLVWLLEGDDTHDGWLLRTAAELYQTWPQVPGIALLNFPRSSERARLSSLGVRAVLGKPFSLPDLAQTLYRVSKDSVH